MTAAQQLRQEGMKESKQAEKPNIAKNLLSKLHLDMKAVAEATGLSEQELMNLQEEKKN